MRVIAALMMCLALVLPMGAVAEPTSNDRLCSAIGKTRESALQPRDRIFFEDKCVCFKLQEECAAKGSKLSLNMAKDEVEIAAKLYNARKTTYDKCRSVEPTPPCSEEYEKMTFWKNKL